MRFGVPACMMLLAFMVLTAHAGAVEPIRSSFSEPVEYEQANPCNGELIAFSGVIEGRVSTLVDTGGGTHYVEHLKSRATGVGNLGNTYSYRRITNLVINTGEAGFPQSFTNTLTEQVISRSGAPNFPLHLTVHFTTDPGGRVRAEVVQVHAVCRG